MSMRRCNWSEPGIDAALLWLAIDDRKGNPRRQVSLPPALYSHAIAPFLHFDAPQPNQLYVVGGRNQEDGPLGTVEMFDTWHGRWVTCPSMSVRRAGCAAAVLPDGRMLVVGGYDQDGIVKGLLASCEAFDPRTQSWSSDVMPLQRPRWGHGCASLGGLVYAVGGCSLRPGAPPRESHMETLRSCEVYDPTLCQWLPCAGLHSARAGSRLVALGEKHLGAVGGCDDVFGRAEMLPTVELFDIVQGRWSVLDLRLSTPRTTAAVAPLDDQRILVVGGAPSLSSIEIYHVPDIATGAPIESRVCQTTAMTDIAEGRMGCLAATLLLPKPNDTYPLCTRKCAVIVGGENGDEDWEHDQAHARQFNSVLVYDVESDEWRAHSSFPPMLTARTAMALCVANGKIRGHPFLERAGNKGGG